MTFGNPFGLALYDKQQRQVSPARGETTAGVTTTAAVTKPTASAAPAKGANQGPPAVEAPAADDTPLNAPAIMALQARIRSLSPAQGNRSPPPYALPLRCRQPRARSLG